MKKRIMILVVSLALVFCLGILVKADSIQSRGYANPGLLISAAELSSRLGEANLVVLHVTSPEKFEEGHIPGAVQIWKDDFTDSDPVLGVTLPDLGEFASTLGNLGISNNTEIVIYDDISSIWGPRLLWTLRYIGHEKVRYLEGGLLNWDLSGYEMDYYDPEITKTEYVLDNSRINRRLRITAGELEKGIESKTLAVIDVRSKGEFEGSSDSKGARKGHIPTALNLDWSRGFDETGAILSAAKMKSLLGSNGIDEQKPVVVYCYSGVRAAYGYLFFELLGFNVTLYDGSWAEWSADDGLPIEI